MRFKSRMFPLIDVMILLLGLFLVILAQAQLAVQPAEERQPPQPPQPHAERVMVLLFWDDEERAFYSFGDADEDSQRVESLFGLRSLVPWAAAEDYELDVIAFIPFAEVDRRRDELVTQFNSDPHVHVQLREMEYSRLNELVGVMRHDDEVNGE